MSQIDELLKEIAEIIEESMEAVFNQREEAKRWGS